MSEDLKQKYDSLVETLKTINKIATDARNGVHSCRLAQGLAEK